MVRRSDVDCADVSNLVQNQVPLECFKGAWRGFNRHNLPCISHQLGGKEGMVPHVRTHIDEGVPRMQGLMQPTGQIRLRDPKEIYPGLNKIPVISSHLHSIEGACSIRPRTSKKIGLDNLLKNRDLSPP